MDKCGSDADKWDLTRVREKLSQEQEQGTTFVLPLASIIETGNHIAHVKSGSRRPFADKLMELIHSSADELSPWAAFTEQSGLWSAEKIKDLSAKWVETVDSRQSLGDASIVHVAEYYHELGFVVEILTGDAGLKAYEPRVVSCNVPRRRR